VLIDLDRFKRINDEDGHAEGDRFLRAAARSLGEACRADDMVFRIGGDEFALLLGVDVPLAERVAKRTCRAIAEIDQRSGASFGVAELRPRLDKNHLLATADANLYGNKTGHSPREREEAADDAIAVLIAAMSAHDEATADHSLGVADLAERVADEMRLPERQRALVQHAARVHDVGKLAIPGEVLRKPDTLTPAERELIETHPARGAEVLRRATALVELASVVHASHERWDGEGYPRRLAGQEIPLASRIVAVCDAYDAMVSDRPYRSARTHEEAVAELRRMAGSQFDPHVVEAFVALFGAAEGVAVAAKVSRD
jgi:two-component system cell cycle response regulator